jgi:hypothetical protein
LFIQLQENVSYIISSLFQINPRRNSTESVLVGVLGRYRASTASSDIFLRRVLRQIDSERSLNILSSAESWNAFKANWSESYVEALSTSLQSPFALIDSDTMRQNIISFDVFIGVDQAAPKISPTLADETRIDPSFWLPIIAYSLDKASHSAEITVLIERSAIGYALVCLSSESSSIRRMASFVLTRWESLCVVPTV